MSRIEHVEVVYIRPNVVVKYIKGDKEAEALVRKAVADVRVVFRTIPSKKKVIRVVV